MRSRATSASTRPGIVIPPGGIGDVLDLGFSLARHHFRFLLVTYGWAAVPSIVFTAVGFGPFFAMMGGFSDNGPSTVPDTGLLTVATIAMGLAMIVAGFAQVLGSMAVTIACARLIAPTGEPDDLAPGVLYRAALGRLGWVILWVLVLIVPSFFLVILLPLGIYVGIRWSQSWLAIVVDREGPISSLGRSWSLTRGTWWHTAIVLLAVSIIIGIISYAISFAMLIVTAPLMFITNSATLSGILNILGQSAASLVMTPFSVAIAVVLYFELRARAEGFDLEQRALQVALSE